MLLKQGYLVEASGALHLAAERGDLDAVRLLLRHGADVHERLPVESLESGLDREVSLLDGWTPVHFAAGKGQVDAMESLESNGARMDVIEIEWSDS